MSLKFRTIKEPISYKEKIRRAKDFNLFNDLKKGDPNYLDPKEFALKEIYDEYVEFKCLDCGYEETIEGDIVFELFDEEFEEYPVLICPKCNDGSFVPKDIYEQIKGRKHKNIK